MTDAFDDIERIDYPGFIDEAMRGVVRRSLRQAAEYGLPGNHHFFISFDTNFPGVEISPALKQRYPEEITIVLQYQFWDLDVEEHQFSVMLSFNNVPERLVVPYSALTAFADPSIKFGLQFHAQPTALDLPMPGQPVDTSFEANAPEVGNADNEDDSEGTTAEVISLDAFRKK